MNAKADSGHEAAVDGKDQRLVEVELNGSSRRIAGGNYTGHTLKHALGVRCEHELDQVVNGEFHAIPNDKKVHVHGGEKLVSHCGQGQSS